MKQPYNKPYLWKRDPRIPGKCGVMFRNKKRRTNYSIFLSGESLPKPDIGQMHYSQDPKTYDLIFEAEVEESRTRQYDCLPNNTLAPLVNNRVLEILQELCPGDFQAFPAIIRSEPDKPITPYEIEGEYWLINVTQLVDCIDLENSRLTFHENGDIDDIRKIVLKEDCLQEGPVLLARERLYRMHIMASPLLQQAFKKAKIKGHRFVTDEVYNREYFY